MDTIVGSPLLHSHKMAGTSFLARVTGQSVSGIQRLETLFWGHSRDTLVASTPLHSHRTASALSLAHLTRQFVSGIQRLEMLF